MVNKFMKRKNQTKQSLNFLLFLDFPNIEEDFMSPVQLPSSSQNTTEAQKNSHARTLGIRSRCVLEDHQIRQMNKMGIFSLVQRNI